MGQNSLESSWSEMSLRASIFRKSNTFQYVLCRNKNAYNVKGTGEILQWDGEDTHQSGFIVAVSRRFYSEENKSLIWSSWSVRAEASWGNTWSPRYSHEVSWEFMSLKWDFESRFEMRQDAISEMMFTCHSCEWGAKWGRKAWMNKNACALNFFITSAICDLWKCVRINK